MCFGVTSPRPPLSGLRCSLYKGSQLLLFSSILSIALQSFPGGALVSVSCHLSVLNNQVPSFVAI